MMIGDHSGDFAPFDGHVWLNTAHQGVLPKVAAAAAVEAVGWKQQPWQLTTERFSGVPQRLRRAIGGLIGAPDEDIILGNSASYGLHLLANGLSWQDDDEVLTMRGDFPSDILPWLGLAPKGVQVRQLVPADRVLTPEEVKAAIGPRTKLLCLTWVHSLSGYAIDLTAIGRICRNHGVLFVVNASQALGVRSIDVATAPIDALVSVGFKWLCGPYGTGFCWIRPDVLRRVAFNQTYWLAMLTSDDLAREDLDLTLKGEVGARRYDVFGTANFFNFHPLATAIEYVSRLGVDRVAAHDSALVQRFVDGLDRHRYRLLSPESGPARSTLVFFSPLDGNDAPRVLQSLRAARIYVAPRAGALRLSPHLHNTEDDIDRVLTALDMAHRL
jgi:Selenocysteine lyase